MEAMTAGVVLSILSLGLMGVWSTAGASVDRLVIREKAIWALNGQLERLTALYTFTEFGDGFASASSGYGYAAEFSNVRSIFGQELLDRLLGGLLGGLLGNPENFDFFETAGDFETAAGHPIAFVTGLLPAQDRNYVWVDKDRGIVGRFSWETSDIAIDACGADNQTGGGQPCLCFDFAGDGDGGRCLEIMVSLEFPLRWDSAANDAADMVGDPEILSLRTIVGRR